LKNVLVRGIPEYRGTPCWETLGTFGWETLG